MLFRSYTTAEEGGQESGAEEAACTQEACAEESGAQEAGTGDTPVENETAGPKEAVYGRSVQD